MKYLKPQSPIKIGENYIYPLTTSDQIINGDGERIKNIADTNEICYLYSAIFSLDSWIGEGPYTQTATLTAIDGGGQVTAQSTLLACVGIDSTLPQETKDAMRNTTSDITDAKKILGKNTISVSLANKPDVEVELYFLIKEGNGSNVPTLNPTSSCQHSLTFIGKATGNNPVSVPAGKYSEFVVFVNLGSRGAYTSYFIPADEIIGGISLVSGGYWSDTNAYGFFLNTRKSGESMIFSLTSATYGGTEYVSGASISVYGRI